jgi:uncharacterized protein (TIGR00251 family)
MRMSIKVTPGAKKNEFRTDGDVMKAYLTAPAIDGKANAALIKFLAQYFKVKVSSIEIVKGLKSRHKIVTIEGI